MGVFFSLQGPRHFLQYFQFNLVSDNPEFGKSISKEKHDASKGAVLLCIVRVRIAKNFLLWRGSLEGVF